MQRRVFIGLVGGTIAWPSKILAQQAEPKGPKVGFLAAGSRDQRPYLVPEINRGLNDAGVADAAIEYRFADGHYDRLHDLAEELLRQNVSVIIADGVSATVAAKKATEKVPIVFMIGADPITLGLVKSLSRPGANLTGLVMFGIELIGKRLEILRELVPKEAKVALLVNQKSPNLALVIKEAQAAARMMDQEMQVIEVGAESELNSAFSSLRQRKVAAVFVPADPIFDDHPERLVALSFRYAVPAIYPWRQFTEAGGLEHFPLNAKHIRNFGSSWRIRLVERC